MCCFCQIFCSHLEQLIQWLYVVSEKIDLLAPPTVDIESVKSSLAEYQVSVNNSHCPPCVFFRLRHTDLHSSRGIQATKI